MMACSCEVTVVFMSLQTGLGVLPDERNINVPVMVWRSCAYTVMAVGLSQLFMQYFAFFCIIFHADIRRIKSWPLSVCL